MERHLSPFLALGLFFGTLSVQGAPAGEPQDYLLATQYLCQTKDVVVRSGPALISRGRGIDELRYKAEAGRNQTLTFGSQRETMIWPRVAKGHFDKSLNILARGPSGAYHIIQEVDLGDAQKTRSIVRLSAKNHRGEVRPISCQIEMEWVKKTK